MATCTGSGELVPPGGKGPTGPYDPGLSAAYYRTGYFGNESPFLNKIFRFLRIVSDVTGFTVQAYLVDDKTRTFTAPQAITLGAAGDHQTVNKKAHRISYKISWPAGDVQQDILELSHAWIPLSER